MRKGTNKSVDVLPAPARLVLYLAVALAAASMAIPMINVLAVSFSTAAASDAPGLILFPRPFTLEGYYTVWTYENLWRPFFSTLYVSVAGTVLHVFLSAMTGYVLIHRGLPFRGALTTFVMLTMTVPGELTLVSLYAVNRDLGLVNTYAALIVNGAVGGFSVLLMRNYFAGVPQSLPEAARIDGASDFPIFWKIFFPLSIPGIVTIATLQFIGRWNNITTVISLITNTKMWTLPVILKAIVFERSSTSGTTYIFANAKMAGVALTAAPLVILYFFTQRFFSAGVMLGATKE